MKETRFEVDNKNKGSNVLISIKPKYVDKVLSGEKRYEFRKRIWKKKVDRVFIYATSPVKKIVASFVPGKIVEGSPDDLWERCHGDSGLDENGFFNYFKNNDSGFAIKIKDLRSFDEPIDPGQVINDFVGLQSFQYCECNHEAIEMLE